MKQTFLTFKTTMSSLYDCQLFRIISFNSNHQQNSKTASCPLFTVCTLFQKHISMTFPGLRKFPSRTHTCMKYFSVVGPSHHNALKYLSMNLDYLCLQISWIFQDLPPFSRTFQSWKMIDSNSSTVFQDPHEPCWFKLLVYYIIMPILYTLKCYVLVSGFLKFVKDLAKDQVKEEMRKQGN